MKSLKLLTWALPATALLGGAVALGYGYSGISDPNLPTPVAADKAVAQSSNSAVVDGETWTATVKTQGASARGFSDNPRNGF